jgi:tetratricopeptide (TPR) repeat protein
MQAEKLPPQQLTTEEQLLIAHEQQLLTDGRLWLRRAAELYTRTSKIKIWVPVAGSLLMTAYSLYTIHARATAPPDLSPQLIESTPAAVADTPPSKTPPAAVLEEPQEAANATAGDNSDTGLRKRAEQAHMGGQFDEEAKLLQQFADQSHASQQVCPALGKAYERAGDLNSAKQAFEQCMSLEPGNTDNLLAFAHVMQAKQDFERATMLYRQCLLKDPGNADAQTGLALVELKQNHLPQANEAALAVSRKSPNNTDALLIEGLVAWRQSRLADANKIFLKGVELDDRRPDFHEFLGRIAELERRPKDALEQYERALELDPDDTEVAARRDRLKGTQ